MRECFPEADAGEGMFGYSNHVKGPEMKEYEYDGQWETITEHWFAQPRYSLLMTCSSPYIALLSSTCGNVSITTETHPRTAHEGPVAAPTASPQAGWRVFFRIELQLPGVCLPRGLH